MRSIYRTSLSAFVSADVALIEFAIRNYSCILERELSSAPGRQQQSELHKIWRLPLPAFVYHQSRRSKAKRGRPGKAEEGGNEGAGPNHNRFDRHFRDNTLDAMCNVCNR